MKLSCNFGAVSVYMEPLKNSFTSLYLPTTYVYVLRKLIRHRSLFCHNRNLDECAKAFHFFVIITYEKQRGKYKKSSAFTSGGSEGGKQVRPGPPLPPQIFWIIKNKWVFNKFTNKVCINCCCRCSETSTPIETHWWCPYISVVAEATYEARFRALEGRCV